MVTPVVVCRDTTVTVPLARRCVIIFHKGRPVLHGDGLLRRPGVDVFTSSCSYTPPAPPARQWCDRGGGGGRRRWWRGEEEEEEEEEDIRKVLAVLARATLRVMAGV